MKLPQRYPLHSIQKDALKKRKMTFVSGPRQVGKTTLARALLTSGSNYYSYDQEKFRRAWAKDPEHALMERDTGPVVLDEIHKDRLWKRKLKGIYDAAPDSGPYIVTGSARLDLYRRGSDSLLGRYLPYRLHPLSIGERSVAPGPTDLFGAAQSSLCTLSDILALGGFPEPFLSGSQLEAQRWSRLRLERLVFEDTRDLLGVSDLRAFQVLAELLPERVGSALSINNLTQDVGKAYATVRAWYQTLEALYFCFTVRPYSKKITRAIRAEPKMFLFDTLQIPAEQNSKRLENTTALHLLKACHYWTDTAQGDFQLHYVRDRSGREVDFLITKENKPWMLVECKSGDTKPSPHLRYYTGLLNPIYSIQLVSTDKFFRQYADLDIRVLDYQMFFSYLP